MPFQQVEVRGPADLNVDLSPYELPPEIWSNVQNVRYDKSGTTKVTGASEIYGGGPLTQAPLFAMSWNDGSEFTWIYGGLTSLYKVNSSGVETLLSTGYTTSFQTGWHGNVFNGVAILNNGREAPQYTDTVSTTADLPGWVANTRAYTLRPFKNYLVAMNIENLTESFPARVWWSDSADVGSVPTDWDIADPASRSGITDLADTAGPILDGLPLGDTFVIYKSDAVWAMNLVGGTLVFNFRKLFDDHDGLLAQGCVTAFENKHFVLSKTDAYIHDGVNKQSVMDDRVSTFLANIDADNIRRTKVVSDEHNKEIIVYYVPANDVNGLSQFALIWNYATNSWSTRELTNVSWIAEGVISDGEDDVWNTDNTPWNTDNTPWNSQAGAANGRDLLVVDYLVPKFLRLNSGSNWDGTSYTTSMEKIGVDFDTDAYMKRIKAIYPHIQAAAGTTINVEVGHEDPRRGGVTWEGPYPFVVGTDRKIDCRVNGRNHSIRFSSDADTIWQVNGYLVDWKPTGATR